MRCAGKSPSFLIFALIWYTACIGMGLKQQIDGELKQAMLAGDKTLTTILRGLKSAILYVEVAKGNRETGLSDPEIIDVLSKESKKRQESADLYAQGGNSEREQAELAEKAVIDKYLPAQMPDDELGVLVDEAIKQLGVDSIKDMGKVIGAVKQKAGQTADGGNIAKLVKEKLEQ